jgi:Protein of unknown function (DUF2892)
MQFLRFMTSGFGRGLRIVGGLAVIGGGVYLLTVGTVGSIVAGAILAVVGLVFFLAGAFDFCVLSPLLGYPLSGPKTRQRLASPREPSPAQ